MIVRIREIGKVDTPISIQAFSWAWLPHSVRFYNESNKVVAEFNSICVLSVQDESSEVKDD